VQTEAALSYGKLGKETRVCVIKTLYQLMCCYTPGPCLLVPLFLVLHLSPPPPFYLSPFPFTFLPSPFPFTFRPSHFALHLSPPSPFSSISSLYLCPPSPCPFITHHYFFSPVICTIAMTSSFIYNYGP